MRRRVFLLWLLSTLALAAVWVRAFHVQVVSHDRWVAEGAMSRRREWDVAGPRGRILDASGAVLATDRAAVRLVFVPGEWASRERFRCADCGAVVARPSPRWFGGGEKPASAPRRCSCGTAGARLERMPDEDLAPLEDAMGLPSGTLAAAAEERMRDVTEEVEAEVVEGVLSMVPGTVRAERRRRAGESGRTVPMSEVLETYALELESREFYVEDLRRQRRADLYGRPVPLLSFRAPSGARFDVKSLPVAAERLLELDRDGRYRGFRSEPFTQRWYPRHGLLAQCLGVVTPFRTADEFREFKRKFGDGAVLPETRVGRLGLEAAYDDALRGGNGRVRAERDDDGLFSIRTVVDAPRHGADVQLFASAEACEQAHEALLSVALDAGFAGEGPSSGGFVVLDAETGAILAWAETPLFDPNGSLDVITTQIDEGEEAEAATAAARVEPSNEGPAPARPKPAIVFSRVARVAAEPGSAMKLVTVTTLLHSGHPVPESYHCSGPATNVEPRNPRCHHHPAVGPEGVLEYSCNRWCADCASDRTYRTLHVRLFPEWAARFGIGARTGIDFPGESPGFYSPKVDGIRLRQVSIGQSMLATPLQMARVAAAIGNGRYLPTPRLAATVGGRPVEGGSVPVDFDPTALARVRRGMEACVETGTAKGNFHLPGLAGVTVYGKTGTASVTGRDWLRPEDDDPANGPWHLWFVGYAEKPGARTLAFAMVLHDRTTGVGGDEAAPAVARFLAWWYGR